MDTFSSSLYVAARDMRTRIAYKSARIKHPEDMKEFKNVTRILLAGLCCFPLLPLGMMFNPLIGFVFGALGFAFFGIGFHRSLVLDFAFTKNSNEGFLFVDKKLPSLKETMDSNKGAAKDEEWASE